MASADATVEAIIRTAIRGRSPVSLSYETTGAAARTVHPHVLFRAANGEIRLDGYQVAGPTSSGNPIPGWRQMDLAKITAIALLDGSFDPAPGFGRAAEKYAGGLVAGI
jgi:hypothetical protein